MQVTVRSVSGLQKPRRGIISGSPSPYVVIEVIGKEEVRFQTPVVKQCVAPLWDFACEIDSFEVDDKLLFTLMDCNSWPRSDKVLGKAYLTRSQVPSHNCKLELAFDECDTNATLFLAIVGNDMAVHDQVGRYGGTNHGLNECNASLQLQVDEAVAPPGSMLDTCGNADLSSRPCLVRAVVDGYNGNDDRADSINHSPEATAVSEDSPAIHPLQAIGTGTQARPVLAPCLQPPIKHHARPVLAPYKTSTGAMPYAYTRTVHAPIVVSAEEYARVRAVQAVQMPQKA